MCLTEARGAQERDAPDFLMTTTNKHETKDPITFDLADAWNMEAFFF